MCFQCKNSRNMFYFECLLRIQRRSAGMFRPRQNPDLPICSKGKTIVLKLSLKKIKLKLFAFLHGTIFNVSMSAVPCSKSKIAIKIK